jgi:hypothetical protein
VRTCIAPATVPLVVCLRRAIWCSMTMLPCVVRGLREEGIASRRRIRVGRGREGYVQRLLRLLCLLRLRWLRRGRIGRVRVRSRRLVVWVMDQMAIRRARERRCRLLAGVHGAARRFGSSSTEAGKCPRTQRGEGCRLKLCGLRAEQQQQRPRVCCYGAGDTSKKTVSAEGASHSAQVQESQRGKVSQQPRCTSTSDPLSPRKSQ